MRDYLGYWEFNLFGPGCKANALTSVITLWPLLLSLLGPYTSPSPSALRGNPVWPMTLPFFFSLPPRTHCNPLRQPSSDWKQAQHIWKLEKLEFLCQLLLSNLTDILAAATRCEPQARAGSQCWQHLLLISWEELHAAAGNRSPWPLIYGSFGMKPWEQLLARWSQERGSSRKLLP